MKKAQVREYLKDVFACDPKNQTVGDLCHIPDSGLSIDREALRREADKLVDEGVLARVDDGYEATYAYMVENDNDELYE